MNTNRARCVARSIGCTCTPILIAATGSVTPERTCAYALSRSIARRRTRPECRTPNGCCLTFSSPAVSSGSTISPRRPERFTGGKMWRRHAGSSAASTREPPAATCNDSSKRSRRWRYNWQNTGRWPRNSESCRTRVRRARHSHGCRCSTAAKAKPSFALDEPRRRAVSGRSSRRRCGNLPERNHRLVHALRPVRRDTPAHHTYRGTQDGPD